MRKPRRITILTLQIVILRMMWEQLIMTSRRRKRLASVPFNRRMYSTKLATVSSKMIIIK